MKVNINKIYIRNMCIRNFVTYIHTYILIAICIITISYMNKLHTKNI